MNQAILTPDTQRSRDPHLDALRGLCLVLMSFNHLMTLCPGLSKLGAIIAYPVGLFSMAEGFVFLSGFSCARVFRARGNGITKPLYQGMARRLLRIYAAHVSLCIYLVAACQLNPGVFGRYPFLQSAINSPGLTIIKSFVLLYSPATLDVLPLYLLYLAGAPLLLRLMQRNYGWIVFLGSAFLWLLSQLPIDWIRSMSQHGFFQGFNPIAWQFLFVLGLLSGYRTNSPGTNSIKRIVLPLSLIVVLLGVGVRREFLPFTTPEWMGGYTWAFRNRLHPALLLDFLAAAYLIGQLLSFFPQPRNKAYLAFGAWWGKNSLFLFWINIILWHGFLMLSPLPVVSVWLQVTALISAVVLPVIIVVSFKRLRTQQPSTSGNTALIGPYGNSLFLCSCALLPIAYLPGIGVPYREPRIIALWILGACSLIAITTRLTKRSSLPLPKDIFLILGILAFQLFSLTHAPNTGLALQSFLTLLAATISAAFVFYSGITLDSFGKALLVPTTVISGSLFIRIFFGISLMPEGNGLGGFVGERNSGAIFLAAILPLFLVLFAEKQEKQITDSLWTRWCSSRSLYLVATLIATFFIIAMRTRSAWWMMAFYGVFLLVTSLTGADRTKWRQSGSLLLCSVITSVIILSLLPNHLRWRSSTPYTDSLSTMLSLDATNGRVELWRAGVAMAASDPWQGVGIGNYVVRARGFMRPDIVDTRAFAFLRKDLPLFNDYLQAFVEGGVAYGILYLSTFLIIPFFILGTIRRLITTNSMLPIAAALACAGLSLNGLFDYPFNRSETLFLFMILCALSAKERNSLSSWIPSRHKSALIVTTILSSIILLSSAAALGSSLTIRRFHYPGGKLNLLEFAWAAWPWDIQWDEWFVQAELNAGRREKAIEITKERSRIWPEDPGTFLSEAAIHSYDHHYSESLTSIRRALFEIPGGWCSWQAKRYLEEFIRTVPLSPDMRDAARKDLSYCR